jgi:WD40 repeat protein/serine/threonine protein kinase
MNAEEYQKVKEIFQSVLEIPPESRHAFLDKRCDGDDNLRAEVERLLASNDSEFMEVPAVGEVSDAIESASSKAGQVVGHYTLIRQIGSGGMGDVYLAEDGKLGRKVAIKILPDEYTSDGDRLHRFQQEARSASSLNHPNIITIHEIGEHAETHYIATEYVEGETLRNRLYRERLSISEALDYGVQLAAAIATAHEAGITHRDVKPENIMIRRDRILKVLDFGLAKAWNSNFTPGHAKGLNDEPTVKMFNTLPGVLMGTVQYMSPEQARGQTTDSRSDVWSLGCVLYEMFTGTPAFKGDSTADLFAEIVKSRPISVSQLNPEVPERLDEIISKSLEKEVEDRYQTSRDLLNDLKILKRKADFGEAVELSDHGLNADSSAGAATGPNLITTRSGPKDLTTVRGREYLFWGIKAHRLMSFWIGLLVIALLVGTAVLVRKYWRDPNEVRIEYANKIKLAAQALDSSNLPLVRQLLDETTPLTGDTDLRGFEWGYLARIHAERTASQPITLPHDGWVDDLSFSKDGKFVASASTDARVWDVSTGDQVLSINGHSKSVASVAISPDGTKLATGGYDLSAKLWEISTGKLLWTIEDPNAGIAMGRLAFSLDGRTLYTETAERKIRSWDTFSGNEISDQRSLHGVRHPFAWSADGKYVAGQTQEGGTVDVKEIGSGRTVATLQRDIGWVIDVKFSPDSKSLLVKGSEGIVYLWEIPSGKQKRKFERITCEPTFSPDGKFIAMCSKNAIILWRLEKGIETAILRGHTGDVRTVEFSPDSLKLASGGDNTVRIWNVPAAETPGVLRGHSAALKGLSFSHDGALIASASEDKTAKVWDLESERENLTLAGHGDHVNSTSFSSRGKTLATGSQDGWVRIWDIVSGRKIREFDTQKKGTVAIFSPDGLTLATSYFFGAPGVQIWNAESGKEVCSFGIEDKEALSAEFSLDGKQITASFGDNTVRRWDASTCKERIRFIGNPQSQYGSFFRLSDGKLLAVEIINNDRSVKLIDPENWKEISSISGHDSELRAINLSPDGTRLATCADDGTIKIWDVSTNLELLTIKPGAGRIESIVFSPDGNTLAAGAADGTVRLFRSNL